MWVAPIGAFGAIAFTVGKFGLPSLLALGKLVSEFYLCCLLFVAIVLTPIAYAAGINILQTDSLYRGRADDRGRHEFRRKLYFRA